MQEHTTHDPTQKIPFGYCQCGCGKKTKIAPYNVKRLGWVKGQPIQFVNGHNAHNPHNPIAPQNTTKLCECGCGLPTTVAKRTISRLGWRKGQPKRFINHHTPRKYSADDNPNPSGLCMCGCGQPTPIATRTEIRYGWVAGAPYKFIPSHACRRPVADRFWEKVDKRGPDECWEWKAATSGFGYGTLRIGYKKDRNDIQALAHRVSFELHNGPVPDGLWVLHKCDNPACVNPNHLFLGTQSDNVHDMWAKGRASSPPTGRGESCSFARLTADQVISIRQRVQDGTSQIQIARELGVGASTIGHIVRRETWTHIP